MKNYRKLILKEKRIIAICVFLTFLLTNIFTVAIADGNNGARNNIAKWTYMIYASWDTKLCINDTFCLLRDMERVGSNEELNIVMLMDTKYPVNKTSFYYVIKNNTVNLSWYEKDSNLGDKDTLTRFIKRVKTDFPAEKYGLILASPHGMSWQGVCQDNDLNKGYTQSQLDATFMDMSELTSALRECTNNGRDKIDLIGFCCCITGSLEVAYQIAPYVNYMVASEQNMQSYTSNPEYTWPHYKSVSALKNDTDMTPEQFAKCIVSNFKAGCNTSAYLTMHPFKKKVNIPVNTTLSAVNLSRINDVAIAVDNLALNLIDNISEYKDIIKNARSEAKKFGPWYAKMGYFTYGPTSRKIMAKLGIVYFMDVWIDLYHFSELLYKKVQTNNAESERIKIACLQVMNAINLSIMANNVVPGDNAHGLHIYFPPNAGIYDKHLWPYGISKIRRGYAPYENLDFARTTHWNELLYKVYGIPNGLVNLWLKLKIRTS